MKTFWMVVDPGPKSMLKDICFRTTPAGFYQYVNRNLAGTLGISRIHAMNVSFYEKYDDAFDDAMKRIDFRERGKR